MEEVSTPTPTVTDAEVERVARAITEAAEAGMVVPLDWDDAHENYKFARRQEARAAISAMNRSDDGLSRWQPIETLDIMKLGDGEEMLIVNDRGMFVGAWEPDWSRELGFHGGWWMISDGKDIERALRGDTPTHWQPLPAPPTLTKGIDHAEG